MAEEVLGKGSWKNAPMSGAGVRFMPVLVPFVSYGLHFFLVRGCFQPREVHKSCLRRYFVLQSFAVGGHCVNCIQQSGVVTEPQRCQKVNTLCVDLDFVPAHVIFASQASHDLGHKGCSGMDVQVTVCSSNRNVIVAWAWMLWCREDGESMSSATCG